MKTPVRSSFADNRTLCVGSFILSGAAFVLLLVTSWRDLTPAQGTVLGGAGVLGGAIIAFTGVRHSQRVAVATSKAQLRQQASASLRAQRENQADRNAQSELERQRHKREVTHQAFLQTIERMVSFRSTVLDYYRWIVDYNGPDLDDAAEPYQRATDDQLNGLAAAGTTLMVLGHAEAYQSVFACTNLVRSQLQLEARLDVNQFQRTWIGVFAELEQAYKEVMT